MSAARAAVSVEITPPHPAEPHPDHVRAVVAAQRRFFASGKTRDLGFRIEALKTLRATLLRREAEIKAALALDLGKPSFEAVSVEVGFVVGELNEAINHTRAWAKPRWVMPTVLTLPGSAFIRPDPLGVVLNIAPWNYPIQLAFAPLVGAVAAGNCAVLKPSELAPHTSHLIAELVAEVFDPGHVTVVEGGIEASQHLLAERFDHVFFTGSTGVGRIVMQAAAKHLTPVTLELGGKSPCVVEMDADLPTAARRILWGKFSNAGQTCVAPDYILVHESIKPALVERLRSSIEEMFGEDPKKSAHYGRIISQRHLRRLQGMLGGAHVLCGGEASEEERYLAPTLVDGISWDHPLMQEEIFGPILPILSYRTLDEAIGLINARPKPLALYCFTSNNQSIDRVLAETSSGGACINDTMMHVSVPGLPFGGVGESGMGSYHSRKSFDTFSHLKSVLKRGSWPDPRFRYAPYAETAFTVIRRYFGMG